MSENELPEELQGLRPEAKETAKKLISITNANIATYIKRIANAKEDKYVVVVNDVYTAGVASGGMVNVHSYTEALELNEHISREIMNNSLFTIGTERIRATQSIPAKRFFQAQLKKQKELLEDYTKMLKSL